MPCTLRGSDVPGKATPKPIVSHILILIGMPLSRESFMSSEAKGTTKP